MLSRWKERRLIQWGIAYLGGAWVVIQVLDALAEPWGVPAAIVRAATVLLAAGFVVSMVLAWYHGDQGRQKVSGVEVAILGAVVFVAGILVWQVWREEPPPPLEADATGANTIAVTPFLDLSPDGTQQYFGDGIADEIISALSRDGRLRVAGRSSTFSMRGRSATDIGRTLDVANVLEGTLRTEEDRIRVHVSLVNTEDGFERWSRGFDRSVSSVLQIQAEIAAAVAAELTGSELRIVAADSVAPQALELYFQARAHWTRRTGPDLLRAVELFEQAVELAPTFSRAHSGLADTYAVSGFYSYLPASEAFPAARRIARQALELDPDLADAYATIAYADMYYDRDWSAAEAGYARAIELNPDYPFAHQWYGNLLTVLGRHDAAVESLRRALSLEPLSVITQAALPWGLYYARRYEESLARLQEILRLDPRYELAHYWAGWSREQLGEMDEAVRSHESAVTLSDSSAITVAGLARMYGVVGRVTDAEALIGRLTDPSRTPNPPAYEVGKAYLGIGQVDTAFEWFERAFEQRALQLAFVGVDPQLDGVRGRPELISLIDRLGL